jgi:D-arginine dehydrogenase
MSANNETDFAIIGGGIAGASLAYRLAEALGSGKNIKVFEREDRPGYHSTGRSAAVYTETYGPPVIRALTAGSRPFFDNPPDGFASHDLLHPLGLLLAGTESARSQAEKIYADCRALTPNVTFLEGSDITDLVPVLRPAWTAVGVLEPDAMSMDVAALHDGYLRGFKAMGGEIIVDAEILGLNSSLNGWDIETKAGRWKAQTVINAAGAWADEVVSLAQLSPLGLQPKRRTAIVFQSPDDLPDTDWPMVNDVDETFYFKPDAGRILASPEEETPMPACDVQPDELDIAITVDRLQQATTFDIKRIDNKWAGLRSFFSDGVPCAGFDSANSGFFWLAGQGGYGITTSDAMARVSTALLLGKDTPADLVDIGVDISELNPGRFS